MSTLFCCSNVQPYRPQTLSHEHKFVSFMKWATFPRENSEKEPRDDENSNVVDLNSFVIQLVKQINFGALESKRYFAFVSGHDEPFVEVTEKDLISANYMKLNS
jgi:hypothetical protein